MGTSIRQADILGEDTLGCILQLELDNARLFLALLEREQSVLTAGNIDELVLLTAEKDRLVDQLLKLDIRRNRCLATSGLPEGGKGVEAWLSVNPAEAAVAGVWNNLLELARLARQLNHTNAVITSTWLQYTRQTLSALQGAAGQIMLYNPKGQAV
jgi:flagella synthesis protein FlgN